MFQFLIRSSDFSLIWWSTGESDGRPEQSRITVSVVPINNGEVRAGMAKHEPASSRCAAW